MDALWWPWLQLHSAWWWALKLTYSLTFDSIAHKCIVLPILTSWNGTRPLGNSLCCNSHTLTKRTVAPHCSRKLIIGASARSICVSWTSCQYRSYREKNVKFIILIIFFFVLFALDGICKFPSYIPKNCVLLFHMNISFKTLYSVFLPFLPYTSTFTGCPRSEWSMASQWIRKISEIKKYDWKNLHVNMCAKDKFIACQTQTLKGEWKK